MKYGLVEPQPLLNQCKCGQSPVLQWRFTKPANHINFSVRCLSCKTMTRNRKHSEGAVEDWNNEIWITKP